MLIALWVSGKYTLFYRSSKLKKFFRKKFAARFALVFIFFTSHCEITPFRALQNRDRKNAHVDHIHPFLGCWISDHNL